MIWFVFFYAIIKLYIILDIYQQSHYNVKEYIKYFIRRFIFYDVCIFIALLAGLYSKEIGIQIWCGSYIILYSLFYTIVKVKLVFSKRIYRCLGFCIFFCIIYACIPYVNAYLLCFIEFACLPALYVEQAISKYKNDKYVLYAKEKMKAYKGKTISITGSFGKTSTKKLFEQVLSCYYSSISTPKSYNTPLGISKFINDTFINSYTYILLEYGASKPKDIEELCGIVQPEIGVVCEIGFMHMDGFQTIENVIKEKMSLLKNCDIAIVNYDNSYIRSYPLENPVILSYGFEYGDYQAINISESSFDFMYKGKFIEHFDTNLVGRHQLLNLLAGLSYIHYLGLDMKKLKNVVHIFKLEESRMEVKTYGNRIVIDDSFNSNSKGFIQGLNELGRYSCKKILITPGIVELGEYRDSIYDSLVEDIIANTDVIILVGYQECRLLYDKIKNYSVEVYITRTFKEAYSLYLCIAKSVNQSVVLIENDLPDIYKRGLGF